MFKVIIFNDISLEKQKVTPVFHNILTKIKVNVASCKKGQHKKIDFPFMGNGPLMISVHS